MRRTITRAPNRQLAVTNPSIVNLQSPIDNANIPIPPFDVFTDTPFEGNQLAVFPEPAGLSTEEMQTITREMNFSECTFIFPPETPGTDVRMRIFTPGEELPMAGHPTIGSTFALVAEGVITPGQAGFVFGLGVGPDARVARVERRPRSTSRG